MQNQRRYAVVTNDDLVDLPVLAIYYVENIADRVRLFIRTEMTRRLSTAARVSKDQAVLN